MTAFNPRFQRCDYSNHRNFHDIIEVLMEAMANLCGNCNRIDEYTCYNCRQHKQNGNNDDERSLLMFAWQCFTGWLFYTYFVCSHFIFGVVYLLRFLPVFPVWDTGSLRI